MSASPSSTSDLRPRVEEVTDSEDDIPLAKMKTKIQNEAAQAAETKAAAEEEDEYTGITFVDMLRFIVLAILTSSGLSYLITQESFTWGYKPWAKFHAMRHYFRGPINLTPSQLALYNGTDPSLPIYLAVNGTIFDVTSGARFYGPGAAYHYAAGCEANRAFITGCFQEDRTPDLRGVELLYIPIEDCEETGYSAAGCEEEKLMPAAEKKKRREAELRKAKVYVQKALEGWYRFYDKNDKYFKVGKVIPEPDGAGLKETEGPVPTLCVLAQSQRPKRSEMKKYEEERRSKEAEMAKVTARRAH